MNMNIPPVVGPALLVLLFLAFLGWLRVRYILTGHVLPYRRGDGQ